MQTGEEGLVLIDVEYPEDGTYEECWLSAIKKKKNQEKHILHVGYLRMNKYEDH